VSDVRSTTLDRVFTFLLAAVLALAALLPLGPTEVRAQSSDLFISEYIEGSSNNKALEIYNGTGASVDLAAGGYNIQMFSNGSTSAGLTINLTGMVPDGEVFVLGHSSADAAILTQADQTNGAGWFNGNDAVVLRNGTTFLDVIGQVGFDPGTQWGSGDVSTADNTLRRKATVHEGDPNGADPFDPAVEWDGFSQNTFDGLGSHTVSDEPLPTEPTGIGAANPASLMVGETALLTVAVTPGANPVSTGLAVQADLGPIGGSAAQAFVDDGMNGDATAGDLVFSYEAPIGPVESGDKVITATITDAEGRDNTTLITLTVAGDSSQIWEIQGAAHISPLNGEQVFGVDGIVTAVSLQGFWMIDPEPDGDDATSDGIFVFRGSAGTKPPVGSHVSVDGTVSEFRPGGAGGVDNLTITQIGSATWTLLSEGNPLPVTRVGQGGRMPPTEVIDDDTNGSVEDSASGTSFDAATDGIDFWESLEGMYLQVNDALAVGPRNGFGEIAIVADGGADAGPFTERGGLHINDGEFNPERLILDDVISPTPFVNTGDTFTTSVTGVLDYGFGNFKLYPTSALVGVDGGIEAEVTAAAGPRDLAVASFNVENLSVGNPQEKFDTLAGQIVHNLRSPDLLAIQEVQDDSGATNNGVVAAVATWQRLIDTIVAQGGPLYEFRSIDPENNADGGAPGANIRVGFLFRTDRGLGFVDRPGGDSVTETEPVAHPSGPRLTLSPGRIGTEAEAFLETRKSLAGEFRWRGEKLFVVANHFSSKGGDDPLFGRWQPPVRYTEFYFPSATAPDTDGWRWGQAQVVNDFVDDLLALDPEANVIVLGDINDFQFSETVGILEGIARDVRERTVVGTGEAPVLTTLFDLLPADQQYSYVFDGNSQVLDQILVSGNILDRDPVYDVVHVNADFAVQASDHDPSVMRVSFQPRRGR
jgi:predicted extracellular nuclease